MINASYQKLSFSMKIMLAAAVLGAVSCMALGLGAAETTLSDVFKAIIGQSGGEYYEVLREIRFPRVIAAFFVGSALAVAGAIMQGMTRNPLADPGLLGLTSGANMGLAAAMAFLPATSHLTIMAACFIGSSIAMVLVYSIGASNKHGMTPFKLVLAGAAVSLFLQAIADGIALLTNLAKDVSMWTAGGLVGTTWSSLVVIPFIIIGLFIAMALSRQVTIMSLNEEVAIGLGQNAKWLKPVLLMTVVLLAGAAVALIGNLAFVGLIIPHIVRRWVGSDYRRIIPMAMLLGGAFMIFADFIGRVINAPFETPVVSLVAIIGLPFFLFLVKKGGRSIV